MATVYKIHPAIGIARVGNHPSAFFIGPETPGSRGVEIGANGNETAITRYKDGGRIKRQAARFRVFKFNQDDAGNLRAGRRSDGRRRQDRMESRPLQPQGRA